MPEDLAAYERGDVPIPPWNDDEALHVSHRSKLVQKAPEHYRELFPDVPDDLDYVWPGTPEPATHTARPSGDRPAVR
ncbi:hypothetical protein [Curtobacterium flaccumfaciens]|uniref:hypothetical protein n=1 Tax=Curtobacterium flaccumfaciens TaxID=2035 RepID=UPI0037C09291